MKEIKLKKQKLKTVKKEILKRNKKKLVILEFFNTNCTYCKPQEMILSDLGAIYDGELVIFKLNIDDNRGNNYKIAKSLDLRVLPSLLIFNGSYRIKYILSGLVQKPKLEYILLNRDDKCCVNCKKLKFDEKIGNYLFCKKYKEFVNFTNPNKEGEKLYCKIAKREINYKPEQVVSL